MGIKKLFVTATVALAVLVGGNAASASNYNSNSIVDHLISVGENHSFDHRTQLAQEYNIEGYRGTAYQNIELLNILRGEKPQAVAAAPAPAPKQEVKKAAPKKEAKAVVATAPAPKKEAKKAEPQGVTFSVEATAYTAYCVGCSGITRTGIDLRANPHLKVIAVDPNVIPLGSKVYVEGYGEAIAGDTGGAIKGNKIDLFMPNRQDALNFGRKTVQITILK